jgi:transposase
MSMHLAEIGRRVAPGAHAALIIDGAGYHVAARLAVPPNITLVRLPPYAPELNPLENVWEYLRGNKLAITVFESYDDIVDNHAPRGASSPMTPNVSPPSHPEHGQRSILEAVGMS